MPPAPLSHLFDVRFEDDLRVVDQFDKIDILLQASTYPVTLAAFNIEESDEFDYYITSTQDSKIEFKLENKAGFVLNNPRVNTLQLTRVEKLPAHYALEQNYPNPFNPNTTIKYALPEDTFVDVVIYNMLGQRIRSLVSEDQKAGRYEVIWDAKDFGGRPVGSGVYYYMIKTENFKASKKMVFLK
jgi:hypothetical protein